MKKKKTGPEQIPATRTPPRHLAPTIRPLGYNGKVIEQRTARPAPGTNTLAFRLIVEHRGGAIAPQVYRLAQRRLLVGRGAGNDLRLISPQKLVSPYHVVFYHEGKRYWVRDVGSQQGTYYNGERLPLGLSMMLASGDTVQIGDFQLTFQRSPCKP